MIDVERKGDGQVNTATSYIFIEYTKKNLYKAKFNLHTDCRTLLCSRCHTSSRSEARGKQPRSSLKTPRLFRHNHKLHVVQPEGENALGLSKKICLPGPGSLRSPKFGRTSLIEKEAPIPVCVCVC